MRKAAYDCVSCLNQQHMLWAWISLFWVGFTDVYIRLCAMGIWTRLENLLDGRSIRSIEFDVLVVGAGGAGLRAAIEARPRASRSAWSRNRCSAKRTP